MYVSMKYNHCSISACFTLPQNLPGLKQCHPLTGGLFRSKILNMFSRFHGIIVDNNFDNFDFDNIAMLDIVWSYDHNSVVGMTPT